MVNFKVYPYKMTSQSAKALANSLGCKRIKPDGKRMIAADVLINWGSSDIKRLLHEETLVLNLPESVNRAKNKLKTFDVLEDASIKIPYYTTDILKAKQWLADGEQVVERHTLTGHSGQGIRIVHHNEELDPKAKLYVKYIKKIDEYRLHVMGDEVFFVQRKARALDAPDDKVNWQVRNHANGFIYANQNVEVPDHVKDMAVESIESLGLDFGAVDIIYNKHSDMYYVLEVNTAPGLFGTTLEKYVEQFKKLG
jgi:glutathione synthase/RimK-type ligase-like ATP-grasp enzyme